MKIYSQKEKVGDIFIKNLVAWQWALMVKLGKTPWYRSSFFDLIFERMLPLRKVCKNIAYRPAQSILPFNKNNNNKQRRGF